MKRDMDLIREILRAVESYDDPHGLPDNPQIKGYTPEQIGYHLGLLVKDGMIEGIDSSSLGSKCPEFMQINLTPKGHDFISVANDRSLWNMAKEHVLKSGTSFTLDLLFTYLKAKAAEKLGLAP